MNAASCVVIIRPLYHLRSAVATAMFAVRRRRSIRNITPTPHMLGYTIEIRAALAARQTTQG